MEARLTPNDKSKLTPRSPGSRHPAVNRESQRPRRQQERSLFSCSHCGESRTLRAFPTVYGNGSSISRYRQGLILKTGWAETRRQSVLAEKCSPPKLKKYFWRMSVLIIGLGMMLVDREIHLPIFTQSDFSSAGVVLALTGVFLMMDAIRWNKKKYPLRLEDWRNSFFCTRCSRVTVIERVYS